MVLLRLFLEYAASATLDQTHTGSTFGGCEMLAAQVAATCTHIRKIRFHEATLGSGTDDPATQAEKACP
jgi:hypothetical protein